MQHKDEKTLLIVKKLGKIINKLRTKKSFKSMTTFSYEYDLDSGNLSRIENGKIEPKIVMLFRIAEALDMPLSELIKQLENELGNDFNLIEK